MMRINLLPPEILEKRRAEKRIVYVALAAVLIVVVLAIVYAYAFMRVESKQQEFDARLQEVNAAQAKADMLAVFEQKEADLQARAAIANAALADRMNWAKLFDELSLVLPTDMWVTAMGWDEDSGLTLSGFAVDSEDDTPDAGHKAIAKMLVRLADLDDLFDVWLGNSVKTMFLEQPAIQFSATARVRTSTVAPSVDASAALPAVPATTTTTP